MDTEIRVNGDVFDSWTYRKKTETGFILNTAAVCPQIWKKSPVFGALSRAKVVCSNGDFFFKEVDKLKKIFWNIGYSY